MGSVAGYLIDTSALSRSMQASVASVSEPLIRSGKVATCPPLDFEALYSARNLHEYERVASLRRTRFEYLAVEDREWQRALEVQAALATRGRLRDVGMADLLIAAVAERHSLTLIHYDADFDTIADITGQDTRWVVPRGSVA
ncbi:MAG TPA: PIN domain nuclease [Terrimesophilobacter sp.]|nr:PIN domain nuclease [Terrimesophilobacter sp.]HRP99554.1 PIN domain nuclease [Terrimesophilobacter sp.]